MCMLFAATSKNDTELNAYLDTFYKNSAMHPHGWGLAYSRSGKAVIKKEPIDASKSAVLSNLLKKPIRTKTALAHIRYATIGNIDAENCHPFTGFDKSHRRYILIHNGTIFDYPPLSRFVKKQKGETDSERILLYLLDKINKLGSDCFDTRFALLEQTVNEMSKDNKLNLIFTDGEYLFVHTNCKNTLFYLEKEDAFLFATKPLSGERWKKVPFCTLLAYKDGALVKCGAPHNNEYTENDENMKLLYRIFSNL